VGDGDLSANNQIQVRVAHLGLDRTTNTPVVILQEQEGERVLPIWIGPAEAIALALAMAAELEKSNRTAAIMPAFRRD